MPIPPNAAILPDELCRWVVRDPDVVERTLRSGASLLLEDSGDAFFVVLHGALAILLHRSDGGDAILEVLGPGDCVPPTHSIERIAEPVTVSALITASVARVPSTSFARVVRANPALSTAVGTRLAEQHADLVARLAVLSQRAPLRRLAATLLYLTRKLGQSCPLAPGMRVPLSQNVVAQAANVSRQTANRLLRHLRARGLVQIERSQVCVLHREDLEALAAGRSLAQRWMPAVSCKFAHPEQRLTCFPLRRARPRSRTPPR